MVVLILERVTPSLRGELTRWLIQPKAGVFVGRVPARVRDLLWQKVGRSLRKGAATMLHSDDTEQGFSVRILGDPSKVVTDFEGVFLAKTPVSR
jgi:CRISPR-associated protein Cas2